MVRQRIKETVVIVFSQSLNMNLLPIIPSTLLDLSPIVSTSQHCRYYQIGLKVFDSTKAAEMSLSRQKKAFSLGAAPPVFSDLFYLRGSGMGYLTGNAERQNVLSKTDRNNWEENLSIPEFAELSRKIQIVIPGYRDLHSDNVGVWNNSLVCIDFFDNAVA
jgi:hypothetical protein